VDKITGMVETGVF